MGGYVNDVCTGGGRGSPKADKRKGGCEDLTVTRGGREGGGQKCKSVNV